MAAQTAKAKIATRIHCHSIFRLAGAFFPMTGGTILVSVSSGITSIVIGSTVTSVSALSSSAGALGALSSVDD